jgi:hypothetical protein
MTESIIRGGIEIGIKGFVNRGGYKNYNGDLN